ncbi:DUF1259 domain-containing protein [Methylosinus sp. Ce-a6]|uniref:DUF1259 domain-containing protein n=1 Tax=Methylosinus sp. Ce-a6 TaxID=2172005 RepID=UPI00135949FB|nr:DUF1259 domain-containing protein [Methylosinus sp. Ce-a6]
MRLFFSPLAVAALLGSLSSATAEDFDWRKVDETLGRQPATSGDVRRYAFPRSDLSVTLDGVAIKPALALGGWIAFKPTRGKAMVTGDFVLLESEVRPVTAKLIEGGLEITAVHNHLLRAAPTPIYVHVGGTGDPAKLAATIHDALAASKTPLTAPTSPGATPPVDLDTARLDEIVGVKGRAVGGVYQFIAPRRNQIIEDGTLLDPPGPLGVATVINFQPTGAGKAAITGDYVLTGEEVGAVTQALRSNGIEITAVHSHMLTEQPRLLFIHFWANEDALKLAKGVRAALDKVDARN